MHAVSKSTEAEAAVPLTVHGHAVSGIFRLLGDDENSATYAVGWALSTCFAFRRLFLQEIAQVRIAPEDVLEVALQRRDISPGETDIELRLDTRLHLIVEAKAGWLLPSRQQLERYCGRFAGADDSAEGLVTVSAMPASVAKRQGRGRVGRIPVTHLSWADLRDMSETARARSRRLEEKRWLFEVARHLQEFVAMDRRSSNLAYVVSLSKEPIRQNGTYTWVDVVKKDGRYFHPLGAGWPAEPPNYIAFRYDGMLQSVHHVGSADIVANLATENPEWPTTKTDYLVYRLGPPMRPVAPMRTGAVYRAGRVWCAIDALLSGEFETVADARTATQKRLAR